MSTIRMEAQAFRATKDQDIVEAKQRVALRLLCDIDLDTARAGTVAEMRRTLSRLQRRITRERLNGLRGDWSYDLDRHVALMQARNSLIASAGA